MFIPMVSRHRRTAADHDLDHLKPVASSATVRFDPSLRRAKDLVETPKATEEADQEG